MRQAEQHAAMKDGVAAKGRATRLAVCLLLLACFGVLGQADVRAEKAGARAVVSHVADQQKNESAKTDEKKTLSGARLFEIVSGLFLAGLFAGYLVGKARSPDFTDATTAPLPIRKFVGDACKFEPLAANPSLVDASAWLLPRDSSGNLLAAGPAGTYAFTCGAITYAYNSGTRTLERRAVYAAKDVDQSRPRRNGFDLKETFGVLIGGAEAYNLKSTGEKLVNEVHDSSDSNIRLLIYGCLALVSGVALGVWLGYEGKPKCGEKLFQEMLHDDVFWRGIAESHEPSKWLKFARYPTGVVALGFAPEVFPPSDEPAYFNGLNCSKTSFTEPPRELAVFLDKCGETKLLAELRTQVGRPLF